MQDEQLQAMAERLASVPGVVAVVLGGSRARGLHRPDSDYDVGLYYRGALDIAALRAIAGGAGEVFERGDWGPWVDGGAWLTIDGVRVDWIYRDLDRVRRVWRDCQAGRYEVAQQPGHPLGFYSHVYAGEVAIARVLVDAGELAALQAEARRYPAALGEALVAGLWQADFDLRLAGYGAAGADPMYAAGCLFQLVGVLCQALHGRAGAWLLNEKAAVTATAQLAIAPAGFAEDAQALLAAVGRTRAEIAATCARAAALLARVREATRS